MRVKLHGVRHIPINGEFIRLDALLKFASVASSGGEAKILIQSGNVFVGGVPCTERGKKIKPGEIVMYRQISTALRLIPYRQNSSSNYGC